MKVTEVVYPKEVEANINSGKRKKKLVRSHFTNSCESCKLPCTIRTKDLWVKCSKCSKKWHKKCINTLINSEGWICSSCNTESMNNLITSNSDVLNLKVESHSSSSFGSFRVLKSSDQTKVISYPDKVIGKYISLPQRKKNNRDTMYKSNKIFPSKSSVISDICCYNCKSTATEDETIIFCNNCSQYWHLTCASLSQDSLKYMEIPGTRWYCSVCRKTSK